MRVQCRDQVKVLWSFYVPADYGDGVEYAEYQENTLRAASMTGLSVVQTTDQFKGTVLPLAMYSCVFPGIPVPPNRSPSTIPANATEVQVGGVTWRGITYRTRERFEMRRVGRAFLEVKVGALGANG